MSIGLKRQLELVQGQIVEWEEVRFNAELAHRVHTKIKSESKILDMHVARLLQAEAALVELHEVAAELEREIARMESESTATTTTP